MPPPPKRTITLLEAHPTNSSTPVAAETSDDFRASTTTSSSSSTPTASTSKAKAISAPTRTRSRRPRPTTTHAASSPRARPFPPPTSSYILPTVTEYTSITTTSSTGSFATSTRPQASASITISGPPVRREKYEIPDPPVWFPYLIAALLIIMTMLAVLFYLVNFPPTGRTWRRWREWVVAERYGYQAVQGQYVDHDSRTSTSPTLREMDDLSHSKKDDDHAAGFTTSANTPGLHNTPTLYSRRRKMEAVNVDSGDVMGLGITLTQDNSTTGHTLRRRESIDDGLLRPNVDKPLPKPPVSPALRSARAFLSSATQRKKSPVDLESGLQKPSSRTVVSSSIESAPTSPGMRVLEMVGGSVEYAADKMSKFMHDQVKGHPEEGLLLPVRDCEREKVWGDDC